MLLLSFFLLCVKQLNQKNQNSTLDILLVFHSLVVFFFFSNYTFVGMWFYFYGGFVFSSGVFLRNTRRQLTLWYCAFFYCLLLSSLTQHSCFRSKKKILTVGLAAPKNEQNGCTHSATESSANRCLLKS